MVPSVIRKAAADQPLLYNSEPIPALAGRKYTFTTAPIRARGQRYAAYLVAIALSDKSSELARYVRWIDEGNGGARQYSLTFRTPPGTTNVLLGYRVNAETPLHGEFELEASEDFSAASLAVAYHVPEDFDALTDHLEPVFLGRFRTILDTDPHALETDLEAINRRLEEDNVRGLWSMGIEPEAHHWRNHLLAIKNSGTEQFRLDPNLPLAPLITDLLDARSPEVRILDVGAGPLTTVGKVWPGHQVCLVAVDPLAELYDRALAEVGIVPPVRTIHAEAEKLSSCFERDSFDLVICANALDHCHNPFKAMDEMLNVLKTGGSILLMHYPNEAEQEGYSGFHQWNFWHYKRNFIVWNRKGMYALNRIFNDRAWCVMAEARQLFVVMRKRVGAMMRRAA